MIENQNQNYYPQDLNPYYDNEQKEISLVSQTNPKQVLFEIEMKLRGRKEIVNEDGRKQWILPLGCKPTVNEKGVSSLMTDASSVINQNTIMSNLDQDEISRLIIRLGRTIKNKVKMNWKEFGIEKSNLDTVVFSITDPAFMALKRAMKEGEKRFLKTSVRAVESYTTNQKAANDSYSDSSKIKFWRD